MPQYDKIQNQGLEDLAVKMTETSSTPLYAHPAPKQPTKPKTVEFTDGTVGTYDAEEHIKEVIDAASAPKQNKDNTHNAWCVGVRVSDTNLATHHPVRFTADFWIQPRDEYTPKYKVSFEDIESADRFVVGAPYLITIEKV